MLKGLAVSTLSSNALERYPSLKETPTLSAEEERVLSQDCNQVFNCLVSNIKTLARINFKRCFNLFVADVLCKKSKANADGDRFQLSTSFINSVARLISNAVLGNPGTTVHDEEDNDVEMLVDSDISVEDDEKEDVDPFDVFRKRLAAVKAHNTSEKEFLSQFEQQWSTLEDLRKAFLPSYLTAFQDKWLLKLTENKYSNIGLVWRLFAEVNNQRDGNEEEFKQLLIPQPKPTFGFQLLSSTRLAQFLCQYLNDQPALKEDLKQFVHDRALDLTDEERKKLCRLNTQALASKPSILWRFVFPGIPYMPKASALDNQKEKDRLQFNLSAVTDGFEMKCQFLKLQSPKASKDLGTKFNSRSWRTRLSQEDNEIRLSNLVGKRDEGRLQFGPTSRCKESFKGIVPIDCVLQEAKLHFGIEEAKQLFQGRVVVAIDPGVTKWIAAVAAKVNVDDNGNFTGEFKKWSSRGSRFYNSIVEDHVDSANKAFQTDHNLHGAMNELSKNHRRTMDPNKYHAFVKTFDKHQGVLLNASQSGRKQRFHLQKKKQRYWNNVVNDLFALSESFFSEDEVMSKMPLIIVGNGKFGSVRGKQSGCPSFLRDYLSRFFCVVVVDEYKTSQLCPKCWKQLEETKSWGIKTCKNPDCLPDKLRQTQSECSAESGTQPVYTVNRDISAAMNMFSIVACMITFGLRPKEFSRTENDTRVKDKKRKAPGASANSSDKPLDQVAKRQDRNSSGKKSQGA